MAGPEDVLKNVSWPQTVLTLGVVVAIMSAAVWLKALGEDPGGVLNVAVLALLSILGLLGYTNGQRTEMKVDQVKDLSNGRLDKMENQVKAQQEQNAKLLEQNRELHEKVTALALQLTPPGQRE